jgi:Flp pilus assembly protein TadG
VNLRCFCLLARRDVRGLAIVEFALVMPLLLLLVLGVIEFGRLWNVRHVLTDAAREGTRVAVVNNNRMPASVLQDSVRRTVRRRMATAALATDTARLKIGFTGVGAQQPGTPATVDVRFNHNLLAGEFVLGRKTLTLRSTFVMRNE